MLFLLALICVLSFHGYAVGASADGHGGPPSGGVAASSTITDGGPVVHIDGAKIATARPPTRTIALTFDDGPDPRYTPQILAVLAAVPRAGHVLRDRFPGRSATRTCHAPSLRTGSEIGLHTFTHPDLDTLPTWRRSLEFTLTVNAIAGATGVSPAIVRPPYSSDATRVTAADLTVMRGRRALPATSLCYPT